MKNESNLKPSFLHRLPPLSHIALAAASIFFSAWYVTSSFSEVHQEEVRRQATRELESRRVAEIEAIKDRVRTADSKQEEICANAAGFHYPEETTERELARMRRIENCVNQIAKLAPH